MRPGKQAAPQASLKPARSTPGPGDKPNRYLRPLALVLVVVVLYAPVLVGLISQWYEDPDYSHGFVVIGFSAYLIWRKRDTLGALSSRPSWFGFLVVLGSLGLLFLGTLGAELFLTRISLLGMAAGLVLYFMGWPTLRRLAFPLGLLLLTVPLPSILFNQIVFPLQLLASRFATACLEGINLVPVLREGNLLVLPNYTIEVVEACSGIRSLMSLLALALGYGYLVEPYIGIRAVLALAMVPLAVVSNGLRVVVSALLTHFWGVGAAEGFMHWFSGWVIFLVATLLLLLTHTLIGAGWRRLSSRSWQ